MSNEILDILSEKGVILSDELTNIKNIEKGIYYLEKQSEDMFYDMYLYNFHLGVGSEFKLDILKNYINDTEGFYKIYVLFKDWNHERNTLSALLNSTTKAKEKREIKELFTEITPIYSESKDSLKLKVDMDGINFLEMTSELENEKISAMVYNVSMLEMEKLFNITGNNLFGMNIRYGIQNKKSGKDLREVFKKYIRVGLSNNKALVDFKDILIEEFNLSTEEISIYDTSRFWYSHNGINIFIDGVFDSEGSYVIFNPEMASVINGAQTLTNFFLAKEEIKAEFVNLKISENVESIFNNLLKEIVVKTVFIQGEAEISNSITRGLNTQIPINEMDFLATSTSVDDLNDILKMYQIKILRTGEMKSKIIGLTPLEFVKQMLIVNGNPGSSKNFNKAKLSEELSKQFKILKDDVQLAKGIEISLAIDSWWKRTTRNQAEKTLLIRYGKNYFQSFVLNKLKSSPERFDSFISEELEYYYLEFLEICEGIELDINSFKSDNDFKTIILESKIFSDEKNSEINKYDTDELKVYINKNMKHKYTMTKHIRKFNQLNNIEVQKFRTISKKSGKVQEHFPLPNSTFSELYQRPGYLEDDDYPTFENSRFKKEIEKMMSIYIIEYDENNKVRDVKFIKEFTLSEKKEAISFSQKVYNQTIEAFKTGNKLLLPKSRNEMENKTYFHVRPKATNSEDTFEFTDGTALTKQTFWANKEYISELINHQ